MSLYLLSANFGPLPVYFRCISGLIPVGFRNIYSVNIPELSLFNKYGEYTGLHKGQIAKKLEKEYRRLWFMLFHYHPELVKVRVTRDHR